jgi:hypothetical protein
MSNLESVFDTLRGWPDGSALENSYRPEPTVELVEGIVVETKSLQLAPADVLKIVDDSLVTSPTLVAADAGKAYVVAGVGGDWSTFDIGDVIEWSGTAWVLVVAAVEAEVAAGTRAVVVAASAAGSFAGDEEKVVQYTINTVQLVCTAGGYTDCIPTDIGKPVVGTGSGDTGTLVSYDNGAYTWIVDPDTPADVFQDADALAVTGGDGVGIVDAAGVTPLGGAWAAVVPVNQNHIFIDGSNSLYENKYFEYIGTHATGAWVSAFKGALAHVSKLSSGVVASVVRDEAWLVIQGNDQFDAKFVDKVTCLKLMTGLTFKVATLIANTLAPGDLVSANAGVLEKTAAGGGMKHTVGLVVESNGVTGAGGIISVAS